LKLAGCLSATIACETLRDLVVKERTAHAGNSPQPGRRVEMNVAPPEPETDCGMEVHEEEWGTVTVQHVYKVRCGCGRSWFELESPKLVQCPACHKFGFVSS
jgi:hypothetical protein